MYGDNAHIKVDKTKDFFTASLTLPLKDK
jgi:hypothetical protein